MINQSISLVSKSVYFIYIQLNKVFFFFNESYLLNKSGLKKCIDKELLHINLVHLAIINIFNLPRALLIMLKYAYIYALQVYTL